MNSTRWKVHVWDSTNHVYNYVWADRTEPYLEMGRYKAGDLVLLAVRVYHGIFPEAFLVRMEDLQQYIDGVVPRVGLEIH
jgi:hypothetical protein